MSIIKSFSKYTISGFIGASIGILLLPILTEFLTPSDYGLIALFNTYVSLLVPFVGITSFGIISVEYFNKSNQSEFKSLFSSVAFIPVIPFAIMLTFIIIFKNEISHLIEIPSETLVLIPIIGVLVHYSNSAYSFLAISKKSTLYATSNVTKVILEACFTIILVALMERGWIGRIESWLLTLSLLFIFFGYYFSKLKLLTKKIKKEHIKAGVLFGLPLILHQIGKIVINQSDRIFISKMVSLHETGLYNSGYVIGSSLLIISTAFVNIYSPYLYERLSDLTNTKKIEIVKISYLFILAMIVVLGVLTFISPFIFDYALNERYAQGVKYVFWIGLSYLFWSGYLIFASYINYYKKNKILGYLAILNVGLNITLNYFFIDRYGSIGAAYATCVSFFVIFAIVAYMANKICPMPWFRFKQLYVVKR